MDEYYNITAPSYNELYEREQLNKINLIKSNISINKNDKLLDVGCGTGISSNFDCFCVGVDNSIRLLKQNKKAKILALAEHLPFKNNSFDIVVSVTALHNFYEPKKALEEMKRVGKRAFIFSVLKKSKKFNKIRSDISKLFKVRKIIAENKDNIFIAQ